MAIFETHHWEGRPAFKNKPDDNIEVFALLWFSEKTRSVPLGKAFFFTELGNIEK